MTTGRIAALVSLLVTAEAATVSVNSPPFDAVAALAGRTRAALFDFDGTLAQSEDTHRKTFARVLGMCPDTEMDMTFWESHCVGHAPPEIIKRYRKPDAHHSVEEMVQARSLLFEEAIERGELPLTAGTRELLLALREHGVRCVVVTSGARSYIEKALNKLGIGEFFEFLVTGTDEEVQGRTKPNPFPFLHAAELLGVEPEHCLAFEDSPTGITSAQAAGMPVVVVANNVNTHLKKGHPGIVEYVPEFSSLSVAQLLRPAPDHTRR